MGMGAAIAYYTSIGWCVSIPLTDSEDYDLVVDNGSLLKVQVKTTNYINPEGRYVAHLVTCGGNQSFHTRKIFSQKEGFLFIVDGSGKWYNIPCEIGLPTNSITLGAKYDEYIVNGNITREFVEVHRKVVRRPKETFSPKPLRRKIEWPSKEEVEKLVKENGFSKTGRILGVSDNAVRKFLKSKSS